MVGARVRSSGGVWPIARSVGPPRVRLALGRAVDAGPSVATGTAQDAPALAAMRRLAAGISAVQVSPYPDLLEARGTRDEHGPHASAVAPGRPLSFPVKSTRQMRLTGRLTGGVILSGPPSPSVLCFGVASPVWSAR